MRDRRCTLTCCTKERLKFTLDLQSKTWVYTLMQLDIHTRALLEDVCSCVQGCLLSKREGFGFLTDRPLVTRVWSVMLLADISVKECTLDQI